MYSGKLRNAVFLAAIILVLSSFASAAWSINTLSEPYNQLKVSNDTKTVKIIELKDGDGNPVDRETLESDPASLTYIYNATNGSETSMEWLHSGYYFASFDTNSSNGTYIEYELNDADDSNYQEVNKTQQMNFGNISVSF
ncbi:MAG: hypothetical protein ABEJ72_03335, partial [Candidatus Aenigmatarchaeota archaeon]